MNRFFLSWDFFLALVLFHGWLPSLSVAQDPLPAVPVFLLAGQSNMQGQAVVDLDHPKYYNSGKGTLQALIKDSTLAKQVGHLQDAGGNWVVRDDVWVSYQTPTASKRGGLGIGYTGYDGLHHFGPELQFGHLVGNAYEEPVLLIKTAWGGKSLFKDFRPPSAGGETGPYYLKMIGEIKAAMQTYEQDFPALRGRELKLAGLVWMQGWNDMGDEAARKEYATNLFHLIKDVRREFHSPWLPVVIGELGNGGETSSQPMNEFRESQASVAKRPEFSGSVEFVKTTPFARAADQSPNVGHGHHWFGNAESYFLIGDALGESMLQLVGKTPGKKRVLILGDSISIGYTPKVRELLKDDAIVVRPMRDLKKPENCQGTRYGEPHVQRWIGLMGGHWDVIHFNFGLHDMKHVDPKSGKNSNRLEDPPQATPEEYRQQLTEIVKQLRGTEAKLIFATTTPVPAGVSPFRAKDDPYVYNAIAMEIMQAHEVQVNDLYGFAEARLSAIQRPANVHFTPAGSEILGKQVAEVIQESLNSQ